MRSIRRTLLLTNTALLLVLGCAPTVYVRSLPDNDKRIRVAVIPFKDAPNKKESGDIATQVFSSEILSIDSYDVIDRTALSRLIEEQKLSQSGLIDQSRAIEIGKLLGADAVLTGAVTEYQQRRYLMFPPAKISMSARLVATESGQVLWTANHKVGGAKRWLTWLVWPVGILATAVSPSAEDQISKASRSILKHLNKKFSE